MTLPKSARTLRFDGQIYRWMVGKTKGEYANIVVETPNQETWSFRTKVRRYVSELPGYEWDSGYVGIPITPEMVRDFIRERLLDLDWE